MNVADFLGNILPLYLFYECWFVDFASNKSVEMVVYSFIHHTHYDEQCTLLLLHKKE